MLNPVKDSAIQLLERVAKGDRRALARCISMIENESDGYREILQNIQVSGPTPLIGITGPPGAGKSTLISALTGHWSHAGKKMAIIAVDPSSPFNHGALMGDRVRMSEHFLHDSVYIRSMATRGSLGGLAPKIFEVAELMKVAGFDFILIETVGVGQIEMEIAGLADITVLVLVPEAGDEIQTLKSGIMEIADIYVVNKSDRQGAEIFLKNLAALAHSGRTKDWEAPVIKTSATQNEGIEPLAKAIEETVSLHRNDDKKAVLLAEKAMMMLRDKRTRDIRFSALLNDLKEKQHQTGFNLFRYIESYSG